MGHIFRVPELHETQVQYNFQLTVTKERVYHSPVSNALLTQPRESGLRLHLKQDGQGCQPQAGVWENCVELCQPDVGWNLDAMMD